MSLMSYMDILKTREVQQAFKAKPAKKKERDKNGKDRPEAEPYLESSGNFFNFLRFHWIFWISVSSNYFLINSIIIINSNAFTFAFIRLSGSTTALGIPGGGGSGGGSSSSGAGGGSSGGAGGGGAGNGTSGGDFLRRSHPLSEHTLHPAYRINYMDLYHQLQASTHSPNASLHGNYPNTQIEVHEERTLYLPLRAMLDSIKRGPHFRRKFLFQRTKAL
ncbi:uncharacterized protein LOC109611569 [Ooceraea biroi]|uniref:uncharacterized protein LOC109611569 n=1 Tax=Ooceraea biroi TaxID=2015173 RepID=UPI0009716E39|nr:uncharacterized protein LOC109611569 [Ooceraea biroi]